MCVTHSFGKMLFFQLLDVEREAQNENFYENFYMPSRIDGGSWGSGSCRRRFRRKKNNSLINIEMYVTRMSKWKQNFVRLSSHSIIHAWKRQTSCECERSMKNHFRIHLKKKSEAMCNWLRSMRTLENYFPYTFIEEVEGWLSSSCSLSIFTEMRNKFLWTHFDASKIQIYIFY